MFLYSMIFFNKFSFTTVVDVFILHKHIVFNSFFSPAMDKSDEHSAKTGGPGLEARLAKYRYVR